MKCNRTTVKSTKTSLVKKLFESITDNNKGSEECFSACKGRLEVSHNNNEDCIILTLSLPCLPQRHSKDDQ